MTLSYITPFICLAVVIIALLACYKPKKKDKPQFTKNWNKKERS